MNLTIQFTFPGEGMVIDGQMVTDDSELMGDEQLDHLPGYQENRRRVKEAHHGRTTAE
jgi:hypothetical protein